MNRSPLFAALVGLATLALGACGTDASHLVPPDRTVPSPGPARHMASDGEFVFVTEAFDKATGPEAVLSAVQIEFAHWNESGLAPSELDQLRRKAREQVVLAAIQAGMEGVEETAAPLSEESGAARSGARLTVALRGLGLVRDADGPVVLTDPATGKERRYRIDFRGAILTAAFHDGTSGKMLVGAIRTMDQSGSRTVGDTAEGEALSETLHSLARAWKTLFARDRVQALQLAAAS